MTKWRKMNSAPRDGTPILVGWWTKTEECGLQWKQLVISLSLDEIFFAEAQKEFDAWTVIPKPPHWGKE